MCSNNAKDFESVLRQKAENFVGSSTEWSFSKAYFLHVKRKTELISNTEIPRKAGFQNHNLLQCIKFHNLSKQLGTY